MSIKPVDLQVMIPKSSEVSKINNTEQQKSQVLLQQQANLTQHKVEDTLTQVYQRQKTFEVQIRERQEQQRRQKEEQRKKDGDDNKGKDSRNHKESGINKHSVIDIKI